MDASGSIGPDNWKSVKTFLTNFLRALLRSQGEDLKVAVICFSDRYVVSAPCDITGYTNVDGSSQS